MAFEAKITESIQIGGITSGSTQTHSGEGQSSVDKEAIAANQTDKLVNWTCDVDAIVTLFILATADMTMKTNDSGAPADTLALKANQPVVWHADSVHVNPLGTDVTALYITNTLLGDFSIYAITDPTP